MINDHGCVVAGVCLAVGVAVAKLALVCAKVNLENVKGMLFNSKSFDAVTRQWHFEQLSNLYYLVPCPWVVLNCQCVTTLDAVATVLPIFDGFVMIGLNEACGLQGRV